MKNEKKREQCKALTQSGSRCRNHAKVGTGGYCSVHGEKAPDTSSYKPPEKSLFRLVVAEDKLHDSFEMVRSADSSKPVRHMLDHVYQDFEDLDGNFLEQFQTTGFDTRFFELYLFAYFSRTGFSIDTTHSVPDFLVERNGTTVAVEATTVNPARGGVVKELGRTLDKLQEEDADDYFQNELPIRFGSPLFSKLQKRYWELEQCRDRPFVIAIEAFHEQHAQAISDTPLINYLYGRTDKASWHEDGSLSITSHSIGNHRLGDKEIPTHFFGQPDTENISAVLFTNSGTHGKFSRMGYHHGFGCDVVDMSRSGFWFNPNPHAMDPTFMVYNMDEPPFVESWGQGLTVFHNPDCRHSLPRDFFVHAIQGYVDDGRFVADHCGWHPYMTKTQTIFLGPSKQKLSVLPWRRPQRIAVGALPKQDFDRYCPAVLPMSCDFAEQQGWFIDETESFIGVVCLDKSDNDWTWVVLARDENFIFRPIEVNSCLQSRDQARVEVQLKIAQLFSSPQRIFPDS